MDVLTSFLKGSFLGKGKKRCKNRVSICSWIRVFYYGAVYSSYYTFNLAIRLLLQEFTVKFKFEIGIRIEL